MPDNPIDQALHILSRTHDGDDLSSADLKLTEHAVNGFLSAAGKEAFAALFARVTSPEGYRPITNAQSDTTLA